MEGGDSWTKGVSAGMTARQARGLQRASSLITIRLQDGELLSRVRIAAGAISDDSRVKFETVNGVEGDFALDDVESWMMEIR